MEPALSGDLGWHAAMLLDSIRVDWFARAIAANVRPDDIVLDVGSGTGVLAMLSARAGARRVYAIEQSPISELARQLIKANGLDSRIEIVSRSSFDATLRERANVVVSETLGAWGADEGIVAIMADAARRLAVPHARFVPDGVTLWLAPVDTRAPAAPHLERLGLDFTMLFERLVGADVSSHGTQMNVSPLRLLAPAKAVLTLQLGRDYPAEHNAALEFALQHGSRTGALAGWFSVTASGVPALTTGPADPKTVWGQLLMPLSSPISGPLTVHLKLAFERDALVVDMQAILAAHLRA